ncbi:MAG TPA: biotin/lipoyl-binding protein, partial [Gammaproteobacteria bacterium]|nr:biotin/lipoyl-binding protein [Gammaproteobacteria bacterium]
MPSVNWLSFAGVRAMVVPLHPSRQGNVRMKNKKPLALLLIVAGVIMAIVVTLRLGRQEAGDSQLTLYGNVDIREVRLAFNGNEHIGEILVEEGDRVQAGQLLARLHTARLEARVREAEARLEAQRQVVARLEAGSRPEEIKRARAELEAARARAKAAADTARRLVKLAEKKLASPEDAENARSLARAAEAQVRAARETLALLEEGPRKEDIAAARAELAAREAALALARERLADAFLKAPA